MLSGQRTMYEGVRVKSEVLPCDGMVDLDVEVLAGQDGGRELDLLDARWRGGGGGGVVLFPADPVLDVLLALDGPVHGLADHGGAGPPGPQLGLFLLVALQTVL